MGETELTLLIANILQVLGGDDEGTFLFVNLCRSKRQRCRNALTGRYGGTTDGITSSLSFYNVSAAVGRMPMGSIAGLGSSNHGKYCWNDNGPDTGRTSADKDHRHEHRHRCRQRDHHRFLGALRVPIAACRFLHGICRPHRFRYDNSLRPVTEPVSAAYRKYSVEGRK